MSASPLNAEIPELVFERIYDAPRELVYRAWTEVDRLGQWFGPTGFTTTTREFDLRPGGIWRFVMHGPDGVDWPNLVTYREVVPNERLTYFHTGDDSPTDHVRFDVTVLFEAISANRTKLTMRMLFATIAARDEVIEKFGALEGAEQNLDRLGAHLAASQAA